MRNALWVFETETTTTATHAVVSERLELRYGSVADVKKVEYLKHLIVDVRILQWLLK